MGARIRRFRVTPKTAGKASSLITGFPEGGGVAA